MKIRTIFAQALAIALLAGCAAHRTPQAPAPPPGEFAWSTNAIEGVGTAGPDSAAGAPRMFVGQQASKTAALNNLKNQVVELQVTPEHTLGSLMQSNLSIRRAVDRQLQKADVVSQQQLPDGTIETRVRLSLDKIDDVLRQHNITAEGLPPLPEEEQAKLPPLS